MADNNPVSDLIKQLLQQQGLDTVNIQDLVGFVQSLFGEKAPEETTATNNGFSMQLPNSHGELIVEVDMNGVLFITISNNETISSTLRVKGVDTLWLVELASNIHKLTK